MDCSNITPLRPDQLPKMEPTVAESVELVRIFVELPPDSRDALLNFAKRLRDNEIALKQ